MNNKIITIRKYEKLVSPPDDDTDMFWIKFFPDKLLGSMNFKRCNCYEQSLYLAIFVRVRRDKEYCGQLVYPNGNPISLEELINDMNPPRRSRTDLWSVALVGLINKELVYLIDATTRQLPTPLPTPLHANLKHQPIDKSSSYEASLEESRIKYSKESILDIYAFWLTHTNLVKHEKLTDHISKSITKQLKTYSIDIIKKAIDNYSEILANPDKYYWTKKWTIQDFMSRGVYRFVDEAQPLASMIKGNERNKLIICPQCNGKKEIGKDRKSCPLCWDKSLEESAGQVWSDKAENYHKINKG